MRFAYLAANLIFFTFITAPVLWAFEIEGKRIYPASQGSVTLRIISTADINVFEPIILEFQRQQPTINIDYIIASSTELMKAIHQEQAAFDLAISSAMDLQTKIANDGYAQTYSSDAI